MLNIPQHLLEQVDGIVFREETDRTVVIQEAMQTYESEHRKSNIRLALQQGYMEMAHINLYLASEAFLAEQEAGGTVDRVVSGV
ncbi:antitoxin [Alicyclobacillaceae bacterium I2511]|nr:antitoxin [Alicyclobacillaceae bacterium I2511]